MAKKASTDALTQRMFRDPSGQRHMFEQSLQEELEEQSQNTVECLGNTFPSESARREHYMGLLRDGLQDLYAKLSTPFVGVDDAVTRMKTVKHWPMGSKSQLRDIAERMCLSESSKDLLQRWKDEIGFPHGELDDILRLSDPPYYTACPNPFIGDFIECHGRSYDTGEEYSRKPFTADVSEGKNDPIYNAHSYHTKVPHKAIMRYILHYTQPGDVVLDAFCGTGMTGVAAQCCADPDPDFRRLLEAEWDDSGHFKPVWGVRRSVLCDLSPAASFIAHNYNTPVHRAAFRARAASILEDVAKSCNWMYETTPARGQSAALINYTIWSDVFVCPVCSKDIVFWDAAVDYDAGVVNDEFACPSCKAVHSKRTVERRTETVSEQHSQKLLIRAKQLPVMVGYIVDGKHAEKKPSEADLALIARIEAARIPVWFPTTRIDRDIDLWYERDYRQLGIYDVSHFYTKRNLWTLGEFRDRVMRETDARIRQALLWMLTAVGEGSSRLNRERPGGMPSKLSGTLYVGATIREINPIPFLRRKAAKLSDVINARPDACVITTQSAVNLTHMPDNSIDYIFVDPPFGSNIIYSDLSILWESWLSLATDPDAEAVIHRRKKTGRKALPEYFDIMLRAFSQMYRVLKPNRWITIEFHNTQNAVWNAIQEALSLSGFVVADVRSLDKKQGSFKQVTTSNAVKQDLIISAYKANGGLEDRFKLEAGTDDGAWDFVRTHLRQLPVFVAKAGKAESIAERQSFMLFDRMVAFHIQRGVSVPLSAAEFYGGLNQRFIERDSMYFLPEQAADYDRKRATVDVVEQLELIPRDEESAIRWLRQELKDKPRTFQEISPHFMREINGWLKFEKPIELRDLLEQNFLCYDGKGEMPSQIHAYLSSNFKDLRKVAKDDAGLRSKATDRWYVPDPNKLADLEKLREKDLLKEFAEYRQSKLKKLKVFRLEAVRAGFKAAYDRQDYMTIVEVARKLPENVLQEDEKLLMYYDVATMRLGDEGKDKLFQ